MRIDFELVDQRRQIRRDGGHGGIVLLSKALTYGG